MSYQRNSARASLDLRSQYQQLEGRMRSEHFNPAYQQQQQKGQNMPLSLPSSLAQRNPIPYPIDAVTSDPTIPAQLNVYDHDRQNSIVDAAAGTNTTHSLNSNNIPSSQNNNINNNNINNVGSFTDPSMLTLPKMSLHSHQKQYDSNQNDPRSPLAILIPTSAQPTDVLSARFSAWRNVIRAILVYLSETASIQDEIVRQQLRLSHAVQFPFFSIENQYQPVSNEDKSMQKFFLPLGSGSVQDLPTMLTKYHDNLASLASKNSKELTSEIIPRLEDLRRDLLVKIKEIKALQSDFKNSCSKELQQTKHLMKLFNESLKECKLGTPKSDPFLIKLQLEKQIKRQLVEENYLHEAFDNLQNSGAQLESVIVMEIQNGLTSYARILGKEAQVVFDSVISKLDSTILNKNTNLEWDSFILRNISNFVPPNLPMRRFKEILYSNQNDPFTFEVKSGFLEKRSKFLKSYSRGFYVLTPSFLHEFKTPDKHKFSTPLMSIPLVECTVTEHSKKTKSNSEQGKNKFILRTNSNGLIHRGHNWVFKVDSYDDMIEWFGNIKALSSLPNYDDKCKYVSKVAKLSKEKAKSNENTTESVTPQVTNEQHTRYDDVSSSNFPLNSIPKLDNLTITNTTSSIPETNDSQIQNRVPEFYIENVDSPRKSNQL
ncbi:phosphatidylinositol 4,5-bisphosphate-binding protein [Saccharomyces cerevisiae]|nr:phosphatidylinositol 4,5-bisphosphate-binding protein [Saccharomyces cerevisiae]